MNSAAWMTYRPWPTFGAAWNCPNAVGVPGNDGLFPNILMIQTIHFIAHSGSLAEVRLENKGQVAPSVE